jgi:hypothetical protein
VRFSRTLQRVPVRQSQQESKTAVVECDDKQDKMDRRQSDNCQPRFPLLRRVCRASMGKAKHVFIVLCWLPGVARNFREENVVDRCKARSSRVELRSVFGFQEIAVDGERSASSASTYSTTTIQKCRRAAFLDNSSLSLSLYTILYNYAIERVDVSASVHPIS